MVSVDTVRVSQEESSKSSGSVSTGPAQGLLSKKSSRGSRVGSKTGCRSRMKSSGPGWVGGGVKEPGSLLLSFCWLPLRSCDASGGVQGPPVVAGEDGPSCDQVGQSESHDEWLGRPGG